jgi:hypothetical protein
MICRTAGAISKILFLPISRGKKKFRWEETLCIIMSGKLRKCSFGYKGIYKYLSIYMTQKNIIKDLV